MESRGNTGTLGSSIHLANVLSRIVFGVQVSPHEGILYAQSFLIDGLERLRRFTGSGMRSVLRALMPPYQEELQFDQRQVAILFNPYVRNMEKRFRDLPIKPHHARIPASLLDQIIGNTTLLSACGPFHFESYATSCVASVRQNLIHRRASHYQMLSYLAFSLGFPPHEIVNSMSNLPSGQLKGMLKAEYLSRVNHLRPFIEVCFSDLDLIDENEGAKTLANYLWDDPLSSMIEWLASVEYLLLVGRIQQGGRSEPTAEDARDELRLVSRARFGDVPACNELLDIFRQRLMDHIRSKASDLGSGEAILKQVWDRVIRGVWNFDPDRGNLEGWIINLANKEIKDMRDTSTPRRPPRSGFGDGLRQTLALKVAPNETIMFICRVLLGWTLSYTIAKHFGTPYDALLPILEEAYVRESSLPEDVVRSYLKPLRQAIRQEVGKRITAQKSRERYECLLDRIAQTTCFQDFYNAERHFILQSKQRAHKYLFMGFIESWVTSVENHTGPVVQGSGSPSLVLPGGIPVQDPDYEQIFCRAVDDDEIHVHKVIIFGCRRLLRLSAQEIYGRSLKKSLRVINEDLERTYRRRHPGRDSNRWLIFRSLERRLSARCQKKGSRPDGDMALEWYLAAELKRVREMYPDTSSEEIPAFAESWNLRMLARFNRILAALAPLRLAAPDTVEIPVVIFERLLRETLEARLPIHQVLIFLVLNVLELPPGVPWTPSEICERLSDRTLFQLLDFIEEEYVEQAGPMAEDLVRQLFRTLREKCHKTLDELITERKARKRYKHILHQYAGVTVLREFYCPNRDPRKDISEWSASVKRHVMKRLLKDKKFVETLKEYSCLDDPEERQ